MFRNDTRKRIRVKVAETLLPPLTGINDSELQGIRQHPQLPF